MDSAFRIKETIYIETLNKNIIPLIPAGRRIPAEWENTFTTYEDHQRSFDIHLLRGNSENFTDNFTLGKWRIAGIPKARKGQQRIQVKIRIGADGSVGLFAELNKQRLPVTFLTESLQKILLTIKVPGFQLRKLVKKPCWACKSNLVIGTENWKNEPFAFCLDCGNEFALPETLSTSNTAPWDELPPELLETLGLKSPQIHGGLSVEEFREIENKGFQISEEDPIHIDKQDILNKQISRIIFDENKSLVDLDYEEIVRLAGDPLPEDQRSNCPECDAVVSKDAARCEWCGIKL